MRGQLQLILLLLQQLLTATTAALLGLNPFILFCKKTHCSWVTLMAETIGIGGLPVGGRTGI